MYHVVKSETAALGRFRVHLDTVEMNDELFPYSYVEQKGSVGILGFDGEKIILIRQYRHSVKSYELEIPGGGMERGENPCETAAREMLEETGYVVSSLEDLGRYYPSPGSSDEIWGATTLLQDHQMRSAVCMRKKKKKVRLRRESLWN